MNKIKANLIYDERGRRLMGIIDACPKPDGTKAPITWIVAKEGDRMMFNGMAATPEVMKNLNGQQMEISSPERLWDLNESIVPSTGAAAPDEGAEETVHPIGRFAFHKGDMMTSLKESVGFETMKDIEDLIRVAYGLDGNVDLEYSSVGIIEDGWLGEDMGDLHVYAVRSNKVDGCIGYILSPIGEGSQMSIRSTEDALKDNLLIAWEHLLFAVGMARDLQQHRAVSKLGRAMREVADLIHPGDKR